MHNWDGEAGVVRAALGGVKMMGYIR